MSSRDGERAASDPLAGIKSSERKDKFNWSADPWVEIGRVEYGADRTMVSTVERVILDADASQYVGFEERLLKVATDPSCTECGYGFICRLLALIGSDTSVATLKDKLLSASEPISHMTRLVIESVGSERSLAALKAALPQVKGREAEGIAGAVKQMS